MPAIGVENSVVFPLGRKIKSHKEKVSNIRHYSGQETRTSWASGLFQNLLRRFNARRQTNPGHESTSM